MGCSNACFKFLDFAPLCPKQVAENDWHCVVSKWPYRTIGRVRELAPLFEFMMNIDCAV